MKKQTIIKIISRMIVSVFLLCFIFPIPPSNAATETSMSSLYSNPNQSAGNNPYKFKVSDVVTGSLLTNVVGCTGVVNKTAKWMSGLVQSPIQKAKQAADKLNKIKSQLESACLSTKAAAETGGGLIPVINDAVSAIDTTLSKIKLKLAGTGETLEPCKEKINATDDKVLEEAIKQVEADEAKTFKEQCFDGIAITLAKNQLTAMARSTMNWVNSGYGGNPFFVQNMKNLTYNIEKNVVETGIDVLLAPNNASPYAADFARSTINSQGIVASSSRFLGGLQSDLSNFISDPRSLYSNNSLNKTDTTQDALIRAQQANNAFARDFSLGGWNGWLALTQREKNNPLGFNMLANQYISDMQTQVVSDQKAEITQNNGFMSQKECISWYRIDPVDGGPSYETVTDPTGEMGTYDRIATTDRPNKDEKATANNCADFKTITPGSLIKDKVGNYLNSPDRQLELVKTINDGLNVLFSALIGKLQSGGLTSLSDSAVATNWTDNMNTLTGDSFTGGAYNNNGEYNNFNLTRDLGNTYIHTPTTNLGTWNAKACPPLPGDQTNCNKATLSSDASKTYPKDINTNIKLYPDTAPEIYIYNTDTKEKELAYPTNAYYRVTTAGKTKLMIEGYNGWEVGDRAFWDGSTWQNWKCYKPEKINKSGACDNQINPIKKRGVIQIQQDYIVAATEIKGILPNVMTSLGKLDYCLPGPNPSYQTNSTDAQSAYQDWINSIYIGPFDGDRTGWRMDDKNSQSFKNFGNTYKDNLNVWVEVQKSATLVTDIVKQFAAYNLDGTETYVKPGGDPGNYYWRPSKDEGTTIQNLIKMRDVKLDFINNSLFQDFYKVFDEQMNEIYFNNMTREYNDTETSIGVDKNDKGYVKMAAAGFDLTKDILYYNDETNTKIQDYTDAIAQAKINIAKLTPIRDEVSGIIQTAQKRRDDNLIKILNTENAKTVKLADTNKDGTVTEAEYKKYYASCLAEEDIQVFDAEGILGRGSKTEENCSDSIDNDLNGLVDCADTVACKDSSFCKSTTTTENTVHCVLGNEFIAYNGPALDSMNTGCSSQATENDCQNSYEEDYDNNGSTIYKRCAWN